ncbi:MAG TPA: hypothetical protein VFW65_38460 [Pseudonocardiaceae bacterium]|nr:hypothetical protein [Pseudonocardiaceae bacterium]
MVIGRGGGLVRCAFGLVLLGYGTYAYTHHVGAVVGIIPAVVGLYLFLMGAARVVSPRK